jgi:hypothetical protein
MTLSVIPYGLRFIEPVLIAAGPAFGRFDRVTALDNDGLPFVPASSIRGRVKDSIRQLLVENERQHPRFWACAGQKGTGTEYCDGAAETCPLCRVFGAPGGLSPRGYDFSAATYSPSDRTDMSNVFLARNLASASLNPRPRNKRDDALRRVCEDHFFVDGVAEPYVVLVGEVRERAVHSRFAGGERTFDGVLVTLGLRLTDSLGATRNRGRGECDVEPLTQDWQKEIAQLIRDWQNGREAS